MEKINSALKYFGYFKNNFLTDFLTEAAGFLIGFLVAFFVLARVEEEEMLMFGSLMAVVALMIGAIFSGMILFQQRFNVAIAMGCTRKRFLGWYLLTSFVFLAIEMLVLSLLYFFEKSLYIFSFPGKKLVCTMDWLFQPKVIIFVILAVVVIKLFTGVFALRYGTIGLIILWGVYMAGCIAFSRICNVAHKKPEGACAVIIDKVAAMIQGMNGMGAAIFGYAVLAIVFLIFARLELKQEIRSA